MSSAELKSFENQLMFLSYAEQLSVMEFLINLMKGRAENHVMPETKTGAEKIFTLMDANPVYSNGQKWTREELYER